MFNVHSCRLRCQLYIFTGNSIFDVFPRSVRKGHIYVYTSHFCWKYYTRGHPLLKVCFYLYDMHMIIFPSYSKYSQTTNRICFRSESGFWKWTHSIHRIWESTFSAESSTGVFMESTKPLVNLLCKQNSNSAVYTEQTMRKKT